MAADAGSSQRIDRFLWFTRLTKTRSQAQALCEEGHIRVDGRRIERAHAPVRVGNVVSLFVQGRVRAIRIDRLPVRRGPAPEAQACYTDLAAAPEMRTTCSSAGNIDADESHP
ncbi:RNA-binding S4 domain-containing protein [Sphingomonas colocasiae]|uniref:RNA-binding S4 domain-containing protein n=1 Tax=Sphingomonas colocasiae TaxID=1848973 RepID=A0ABS7PYP1_9SPHN|nr:RNA-binding S4 domain-containing protein [Sphingomonas colocasiae]MBY8825452.1 RNA-binding S4 domain-containing protein [Sphingomonas colocasiae]